MTTQTNPTALIVCPTEPELPQFVVTDAFKLKLGMFAEKHKNTSDEMKSSQSFWGDLLKILGVRWVPDGTPNRESAKADRIDVSVPGCFIAEQKSRKVNDFKPVWDDQVARYVKDLGVKAPPIRIVCNFAQFEWEHVDGRKGKFKLEDLPDQTEFWELIIDTHNSAKVSVNKEALGLLGDVYDGY